MKAVSMLKVLLLTDVFTVLLLVLLSLGLYRFGLSEGQVGIGIYAVYFLSGLFGGFIMGKTMKSRKFLWGLAMGFLYFVVLALVSIAVNHGLQSELMEMLLIFGLCTGGGMLGGMVS